MRPLILLLAAGLAVFGQNTAKFPGATATFQDLLIAKGPAKGTLTADIDASAIAIPVTDGTQYVAFSVVQIRDEVVLICSVAGNTLNVCPGGRGFTGTVAQSHTFGQAVRNTVTTHHHNQMAAEMKAVQEALGANLGNVAPASHSHPAADLPAALVYNTDVYADPAWITSLAKSKVGLGDVENTALSTWAGSGNITTLGTISSGTVPWARLSNVPSTFTPSGHSHALADLPTGDWSSKVNSGTYSINVTGSAGSATNATRVTGTREASWAWVDDYIALPTGVVQWGVFTPRLGTSTIASVVCWADTGDAVIQLRRNDGNDMVNGNLACNGTPTSNLNGYSAIPVGWFVGMWSVSGTAKRINVGITYTTSY